MNSRMRLCHQHRVLCLARLATVKKNTHVWPERCYSRITDLDLNESCERAELLRGGKEARGKHQGLDLEALAAEMLEPAACSRVLQL